jgi:ElaB/YqjD/DUF883 family membrane-anchored ribosome-binding protein
MATLLRHSTRLAATAAFALLAGCAQMSPSAPPPAVAYNPPSAALATLQTDLAALKSDVALLLTHLRQGATAGAQTAADQIDDSARRLYRSIAAESAKPLKAIGAQIEEQPMMALLIAGGVGFCAGRLLSR